MKKIPVLLNRLIKASEEESKNYDRKVPFSDFEEGIKRLKPDAAILSKGGRVKRDIFLEITMLLDYLCKDAYEGDHTNESFKNILKVFIGE